MILLTHWKCLSSGYGFAGAQPRLAKIDALLAIFWLTPSLPTPNSISFLLK